MSDGGSTKIMASYKEHGSLVYGADWCRSCVEELPELPSGYDPASYNDTLPVDDIEDCKKAAARSVSTCSRGMHSRSSVLINKHDQLIASCSFYDHQLRIWAL